MPAGRPKEGNKTREWPIPSIQVVYRSDLKDWDAGFIAQTTAQERASMLEQFEAKGFKP